MLQTKNVTYEFNGEAILKDVSIRADYSNITTVSGHSGSGKSLLFSILTQVVQPTKGSVIYPNQSEKIRIGAIFQVPALISNLNVFDNLKLALKAHFKEMKQDEIEEKIKKTISSYDLYKYIQDRPDMLSKGQRAILAFCRAMICEPDFFFWDDPFMGIDENYNRYIEKKVRELKEKNKVVMLFTNRQEIIRTFSDCHYKLENGRVIYI